MFSLRLCGNVFLYVQSVLGGRSLALVECSHGIHALTFSHLVLSPITPSKFLLPDFKFFPRKVLLSLDNPSMVQVIMFLFYRLHVIKEAE